MIAAALVACLACSPLASGDPVAFTVSGAPAIQDQTTMPVRPIAPGFVGVSMEYCAVAQYTGATANPVFANLIASLAPGRPVVRVGGDSTDQTHWAPGARVPGPAVPCPESKYPLTPDVTSAISALAHRLNARLILGINLKAHRASWAYQEAAALLRAINPGQPHRYVQAFEIGNEPDLYRRYSSTRGYYQYKRDFLRWSQTVRRAAKDSRFAVAGPSLGRVFYPWITGKHTGHLAQFLNAAPRAQIVAFHSYPFLAGAVCPGASCPTIANLLLDSSSNGLAEGLGPFIARVPAGREFRIDEMGAVTNKGRRGLSNTFTSALWVLDTLFEMAKVGVDGVNLHTIPGAAYDLFSHTRSGQWFVHPEYYGLLMFERAAPAGSQLLQVTRAPAASGGPNVKVFATLGADGRTRILIINKDVRAHDAVLQVPGLRAAAAATLQRLKAGPASGGGDCTSAYAKIGLCATGGVTLGGQTFGAQAGGLPGGDETTTGILAAPSVGACPPHVRAGNCVPLIPGAPTTVAMPPASAALLTTG